MKMGIVCQSCGVEAPTRFVEFHQNIGALIMRFHRAFKGYVCKQCLHKQFWSMTSLTILVGWLGVISIIVAPFFVLNNLIRYLAALGMPPVPTNAMTPVIDADALNRFHSFAEELFVRVERGEDFGDVARSIGPQIGITPGQVVGCALFFAEQRRIAASSPPTGEFPIIAQSPAPSSDSDETRPAPRAVADSIDTPQAAPETHETDDPPTIGVV